MHKNIIVVLAALLVAAALSGCSTIGFLQVKTSDGFQPLPTFEGDGVVVCSLPSECQNYITAHGASGIETECREGVCYFLVQPAMSINMDSVGGVSE